MAKVLLLSAAPREGDALSVLRSDVDKDVFGVHSLTNDPVEADIILFVESFGISQFFEEMRRHPYVQQFREKCFCYGEQNAIVPFLPGVYFDLERRWYARDRTRGGFFIWQFQNPHLTFTPPTDDLPYLYAFVGSRDTHPRVRGGVLELKHPRAFLLDTSKDLSVWWEGERERQEPYWRRYADISRQSKFMLCPRGTSPASVRLFDTMRIGRVPVIIADAWVAPEGPDWDSFSVRVRERDIDRIPDLLAELEPRAVEMGLRARQQWEEWFSEEVRFHRIVEWCLDIQRTRKLPEALLRYKAYPQLIFYRHRLKDYIRQSAVGRALIAPAVRTIKHVRAVAP